MSIDELHIAPTSRHVIPLQGRSYLGDVDDDESSTNGLLTVEFILDDKNLSGKVTPASSSKMSRTASPSSRPSSGCKGKGNFDATGL